MKRRTVVFAPEARDDLLQIYDWIEKSSSSSTALSFIERIEAYCLAFDLASERGVLRDDIRPSLRVVGFRRTLTLAFSIDDDTVTFLRIFYAGKNWQSLFDE
ncbi:MAG: type II toxin-antitoxin system RelE/ParE family toxin [Mesorhizobium sp.]